MHKYPLWARQTCSELLDVGFYFQTTADTDFFQSNNCTIYHMPQLFLERIAMKCNLKRTFMYDPQTSKYPYQVADISIKELYSIFLK